MAWIIRLYNRAGRLLYIAGTRDARPSRRIGSLSRQVSWWGLVDQERTLSDPVPLDGLAAEMTAATAKEHPKYYTGRDGRQPYLRLRPPPSDYGRRLVASGPLNRINLRRGRT